MKKLLLVSLCFLLLVMTQVHAQNRTITGTVKAREDGLPLPGVTVRVRGGATAAATNANGKYTISAPANAVLTFTSTGYLGVDYPVPAGGVLDVTMETSSHELNEVVINTAFGIAKAASTLGYDATAIGTKELEAGGATNFTNGLTGKVAGLVVTTGDNGINPSTRFVLRGNRHIVGNNFALVVLNGVPISPNDVNAINPDDIESVDILNGASAAALYGSEGSNGAMVITTKKGSSNGGAVISYTNTYQIEKQSYQFPYEEQFGSYGGETFAPYFDATTNLVVAPVPYENQSYGPLFNGQPQMLGIAGAGGATQIVPYSGATGKAYQNAFYQTGHSESNNLSYASGDAQNGFNLSVNRLDRTGVTPGDTYTRNVIRIGANHTYGIFKASFDVIYTNELTSQGGLTSVNGTPTYVATLENTPSWVNIENYKDITQQFADQSTYFNAYDSNPYYEASQQRQNMRSDRFNGSFTGTLTPTKWFDFTYRLAGNFGINQIQLTIPEVDFNPIAQNDPNSNMNGLGKAAIVPGSVYNTQTFGDGSSSFTGNSAGPQGYSRYTQDAIVDFHNTFFNDFKANLRAGSTIWQEYANYLANSTTNLFLNNFYNVGYLTGIPTTSQQTATIRQTAYFGDLSIGYKDWANIEGTIRNEHDSRLSTANRSIWFPSVNGSIVLTNAVNSLKNNKVLSYLKLRGSYAQVGDVNVNPYSYVANSYSVATNFPYGSLPGLNQSSSLGNANLKPELTKEFEAGFDYGLFDGRITGSVTYYNDHTTNQTVSINTSASSGYQSTLINVGDMQNQGLEFKLDAQVLTKAKNKVGLDLSGNFAIQGSKVISILPTVNQVSVGSIGGASATEYAIVGSAYPALYGNDMVRDPQGHPIVNASTGAVTPTTTPQFLGRITPKYILGLTQNVSYKFISLTVTEEFRTGNVFLNTTEYSAVAAGTSTYSASNGRSRFIFPNSVINTGTAANPVYTPNTNVSIQEGNNNFWDAAPYYTLASIYTENAAFWKIREADLVFDLTQWVKKTKAIKRASFSFNGRNLFMWVPASNRTHTDPEFGSTGNATGIQSGNTAPTRIFGGTLNVTF